MSNQKIFIIIISDTNNKNDRYFFCLASLAIGSCLRLIENLNPNGMKISTSSFDLEGKKIK